MPNNGQLFPEDPQGLGEELPWDGQENIVEVSHEEDLGGGVTTRWPALGLLASNYDRGDQ